MMAMRSGRVLTAVAIGAIGLLAGVGAGATEASTGGTIPVPTATPTHTTPTTTPTTTSGSPTTTTTTVSPANAACAPGALRATFSLLPSSQGAGQVYYELTVTNRSSATCAVQAPTAWQLLGKGKRALPTHVTVQPAQGSVALAAGQWAQAQAKFSPDVSGPGEGAVCEPVAHALALTVDGGTVTAPMDPTPVCEHGSIAMAPLSAVKVMPACGPASLAATFSDAGTKTTAGTLGYYLKLRNTGSGACSIDTYPALRLIGAHGARLASTVIGGVNSPLVMDRRARWEAYAVIDIRGGACDATATRIRITPSPGARSLTVAMTAPARACHRGRITLSGLYQSG
jgi:hypothetical protein